MKFRLLALNLTCLSLYAHEHHPSIPSKVFATYNVPQIEDRSPVAQAKAANDLIGLLDDKLKKQMLFPIDSKERHVWTNVPPRQDVKGARLGDLNEKQIQAVLKLLATLLSEEGFKSVWSIPLADDKLLKNGKRRPGFGAEDYWFLIFGQPSENKPWAIQFDGHHLALNLTIHGEKMSLSPSFIGTQPHVFKLAEKEIQPIAPLTDQAHTLINNLPEELQKLAIISNKRGKMKTAAGKDGVIPERQGAPVSKFSPEQKQTLMKLISLYINTLPKHSATPRIKQLEKELNQMHFSWSGPTPPKSDISYTTQGPTLIIEYACQNLGGNPLDHLHTMYRDPTNEYGKKTLK